MGKGKIIVLVIIAFFVIIQFIPGLVDRDNPPVKSDIPAPPEVKTILKKACYDCHSNKTQWPWYSRVAPASWLVSHDVEEGREEMNFSTWDSYKPDEQAEFKKHIWKMVAKGKMPLWYYVPFHAESKLSDKEKIMLREWTVGSTSPDEEGEQD